MKVNIPVMDNELSSPSQVLVRVKKRVLVVGDDGQILKSLGKILETNGYDVVLAADSQVALYKMETEDVGLVLLDLNMSDKNSRDTFERMTRLNPFIPVIIIPGRENLFDLAATIGVSAHIEKPLNVSLLLQNISTLLAERPQIHSTEDYRFWGINE